MNTLTTFHLDPGISANMGLGIVEPKRQGTHVPGTATLLQDDLTGTRRKGTDDIVLVPAPSNSPRDPLVASSMRTILEKPT